MENVERTSIASEIVVVHPLISSARKDRKAKTEEAESALSIRVTENGTNLVSQWLRSTARNQNRFDLMKG